MVPAEPSVRLRFVLTAWAVALDGLYERFQIEGLVRLCYETTIHLARRR